MFEWLFGGRIFDATNDIPDLTGKVILVTGGNTGLGEETVRQLAAHNATVYLAARTASKASTAIAEIKKSHPNAAIHHLPLDLSSFKSISAAAKSFTTQSSRLDLLINNAGVMNLPYSTTAEGYEIQLGTNHMGHSLLTKLLLPTLLRTAEESGSDVRIINLSSEGHNFAALSGGVITDNAKAERSFTMVRYGSSKLANLLHARELARRYPQITATSLHPGAINTQLFDGTRKLWAGVPVLGWALDSISSALLGTVQSGAKNQLWAATGEKGEVRQGYYWKPVGVKSAGGWYTGEKEARELWDWTEKELAKHGY